MTPAKLAAIRDRARMQAARLPEMLRDGDDVPQLLAYVEELDIRCRHLQRLLEKAWEAVEAWENWDRTAEADTEGDLLDHARNVTQLARDAMEGKL